MTSIVIAKVHNYSVTVNWSDIAYGNGKFVAVDDQGHLSTAEDFDNGDWSTAIYPGSWWAGVVYGNGVFVAITSTTTSMVATSTDGLEWTTNAIPAAAWEDIVFAPVGETQSLFVAVAHNRKCATSVDGLEWTMHDLPRPGSKRVTYGLIDGRPMFVAVGHFVLTSPNGITWTEHRLPADLGKLRPVVYGDGLFVSAVKDGDKAITSADGVNWEIQTLPLVGLWMDAVFSKGTFYLLSSKGELLAYTPGSEGWVVLNERTPKKRWIALTVGVINDHEVLVAVGANNALMAIALQD